MQLKFRASQPTSESPFVDTSIVPDRPLGDLLRGSCALSDEDIDCILEHQRARQLRFGEAAVALGLAREDDVLKALSQQFRYPYASQQPGDVDPELVAATAPFSARAEVFRDLCSQVAVDAGDSTHERQAIAVVSPDVGDGKSYLAANLAVAFSQIGGRTLLVDADLRAPRQHRIFRIDSGFGLSGLLAGRSTDDVIWSVPDLPSLFVMPVGAVPPNPMELLQRPAFGRLTKEMLAKFDHVVVDTPALSRGADARVIAARCGRAIVVGRKNRSRMSDLNRLVGALSAGRARLAGVVMNTH